MKQFFFITLFFLLAFSEVKAQISETIGEPEPVPPGTGSFSKDAFLSGRLKFDAQVEVVALPNGKKGISLKVTTGYRQLDFHQIAGKWEANISYYARITSADKKTDGFFEEKTFVAESDEDFPGAADKSVYLRRVFRLIEGKYRIGVIVRDLLSGRRGVRVVKFQIPPAGNKIQKNEKK